ncbi:MAG: hypothetical protein KDD04_03020 [Sinomicrobium sp.]|nr:hypothetical protein [Sinomicrobium sp.]
MEVYKYKIGRITYTQTELTWGNSKRILALFRRLGILPDDTEIEPKNLQSILTQGDIIGEFLGIILKPQNSAAAFFLRAKAFLLRSIFKRPIPYPFINADKAGASILGKVFNDFFFLNKKVIDGLSGLSPFLQLMTQIAKPEKAKTQT